MVKSVVSDLRVCEKPSEESWNVGSEADKQTHIIRVDDWATSPAIAAKVSTKEMLIEWPDGDTP